MPETDPKSSRNPNWSRDELILALDLYFRIETARTSNANPEVVALSKLLKSLPVHTAARGSEDFRNPNSVYMKLSNFLTHDPDYNGAGLERGGKLDLEVWNEFSNDRQALAKLSALIASTANQPPVEPLAELGIEEEFPEGRIITRLHKIRERSRLLVKKKKAEAIRKHGSLTCEVCGFDFHVFYGDVGKEFAECHHTAALSELKLSSSTKLSDLAVVCANCHRMLHRARPWKTIDELREIVSRAKIL